MSPHIRMVNYLKWKTSKFAKGRANKKNGPKKLNRKIGPKKLDRKIRLKNWTEKLDEKIGPKIGPKKLDLLGLVNFKPVSSGQSACQNRTNLHFSKIFQII